MVGGRSAGDEAETGGLRPNAATECEKTSCTSIAQLHINQKKLDRLGLQAQAYRNKSIIQLLNMKDLLFSVMARRRISNQLQ